MNLVSVGCAWKWCNTESWCEYISYHGLVCTSYLSFVFQLHIYPLCTAFWCWHWNSPVQAGSIRFCNKEVLEGKENVGGGNKGLPFCFCVSISIDPAAASAPASGFTQLLSDFQQQRSQAKSNGASPQTYERHSSESPLQAPGSN